ncbi:MAG: hypothetical protein JWQ98_558 [Chlorobi bacterium]|nr:hypothetical protein [Chlorobiota bacterium]
MWGDLRPGLPNRRHTGFIPTHVGRSFAPPPSAPTSSVHPHACGEIFMGSMRRSIIRGSSPRMWGDRGELAGKLIDPRFIPTHVGRSPASHPRSPSETVHPHACGEIIPWSFAFTGCSGSSPRMWGDLAISRYMRRLVRFIPTHVGRSSARTTTASRSPVHPHACGEIASDIVQIAHIVGSSPRMWGDPRRSRSRCDPMRFIPTHVGRSIRYNLVSVRVAVHPHACGEIFQCEYPIRQPRGSSPRMWGDLGFLF